MLTLRGAYIFFSSIQIQTKKRLRTFLQNLSVRLLISCFLYAWCQISYSADLLTQHCSHNKTYAFTTYKDVAFSPKESIKVNTKSRQDCMNRCYLKGFAKIIMLFFCLRCLAEGSFLCRAAVYDSKTKTCKLSKYV